MTGPDGALCNSRKGGHADEAPQKPENTQTAWTSATAKPWCYAQCNRRSCGRYESLCRIQGIACEACNAKWSINVLDAGSQAGWQLNWLDDTRRYRSLGATGRAASWQISWTATRSRFSRETYTIVRSVVIGPERSACVLRRQ